MRIGLILKLIAAIIVIAVVTFTASLAYHITVKPVTFKPLAKLFDKLIPEAGSVIKETSEQDFAKGLEAAEMPDYEPGDRAFQKAHELLALGRITEGREKLLAIVNVFPTSPAAPTARRILSMMNLDEILSPAVTEGKSTYTVQRGDTYFGIASKNQTSLDIIIHLNRMMALKSLQPGDELAIMPLNYRIVIEPHRKSLSLWDNARFIADYPILDNIGIPTKQAATTISSRNATINNKTIPATDPDYRATSKSISLKNPAIRILPHDESDDTPSSGIYIKPSDLEELFLLTRTGNDVEFRSPKK